MAEREEERESSVTIQPQKTTAHKPAHRALPEQDMEQAATEEAEAHDRRDAPAAVSGRLILRVT